MRLSEERIHFVAEQIVHELVSKGLIDTKRNAREIARDIIRVMIQDLRIEDEIDAEVVKMIKSMGRDIPEDSPEWNSVFRQKKEELARRRNYVI